MSLGLVLLLLAIVLAISSFFVQVNPARPLAVALLFLALAVWLGVPALTLT